MPVQTLSSIGATAAAFLSVDGRGFLVVSNSGSTGSREINSTVYEFTNSGELEVVRSWCDVYIQSLQTCIMMQAQSIATVGASDVLSLEAPNGEMYIVIASREDNEGSPNVDSVVLRWNEGHFEPFQTLETIGASAAAAFYIGDSLYLAFSSFTDTRYMQHLK